LAAPFLEGLALDLAAPFWGGLLPLLAPVFGRPFVGRFFGAAGRRGGMVFTFGDVTWLMAIVYVIEGGCRYCVCDLAIGSCGSHYQTSMAIFDLHAHFVPSVRTSVVYGIGRLESSFRLGSML
jgi:hypothetical protein